MSSIPLPALHVNPPPDPSIGIERAIQLKSMMQGQQLQQQQIQSGALEYQQRVQALTDQRAMTQAMQEWDGKDIDGLPGLALKHGASAQTVMSLKTGIIKQKQDIANLTKDQLANEKTKNDYFAQALDNVKNLPPEQQPDAFEKAKADAVTKGHLDPQAAQGLQYQGPEQLDALEKVTMGHGAVIESALKGAETKKNTAEAAKAEAETQKVKTETSLFAGPLAEARYRFVLQKLQAKQPVAQEDLDFARSFEASNSKATTISDSLGVTSTNTSKPTGLATVGVGKNATVPAGGGVVVTPKPAAVPGTTPAATPPGTTAPAGSVTNIAPAKVKSNIVDLIGQYDANPQLISRMMYKHPEILGLVKENYPGWDQTNYDTKAALKKGYTSGKQSKEINAINTVMGHLGVLDNAVDALNNGNVKALNDIGNYFNLNFTGLDNVAKFKAIVHRVGPEITTAYVPSSGGQQERFANAEDFSEALAPNKLHTNAAITAELLRSKIGALENQYQNTVGLQDFQKRFITPQAQSALDKFAGKTKAPGVAAPTAVPNKPPVLTKPTDIKQRDQDLGVIYPK